MHIYFLFRKFRYFFFILSNRNPNKKDTIIYRLILLSLPIISSNFIQTLYGLTDSYFLGKLSKEALSAPSIASNILFFLIVICSGISIAGTTLIAQTKAKNDLHKARFYAGQTVLAAILLSIFFTITGIMLINPLLKVLQVPQEVYIYTKTYMLIIFSGLIFQYLIIVTQSLFHGYGNSILPLKIQILSVIINILLDPLLIFGYGIFPRLEVTGAAYATIFSEFVAAVIGIVLLFSKSHTIKLTFQSIKPDKKALMLLFKIGMPSSLGQALSSLGFTVLQGIVNHFGTAVIAAFSIGNRIIGLFNMPAMGIASGVTVITAQCLGTKNYKKARETSSTGIILMCVFIIPFMMLTFFFGAHVVRFFINDPEVIQLGKALFAITSPSVVFFTLFTVITGVFQGSGYTKATMFLNIFRLWGIRVPLAYFLSIVLTYKAAGIWYSMFFSNIVVAIIAYIILKKQKWLFALDADKI